MQFLFYLRMKRNPVQSIIIGSIPLIIALSASLLYYKKLVPYWIRLFPWFLMLTFFIQTGGYAYSYITKKSNHFIFNIYTLIEYGFYLFIFYNAIDAPAVKKLVGLAAVLFAGIYCYDVLAGGHFWRYSAFARNAGKLLTLCSCLLYLAQLLMADRLIFFFNISMFWIATGIMIAAVGDFLYLCFFDYIIQNNLDPKGRIYSLIATVLSIIEYGMFALGFLTHKIWKKAG